MTIWHLLPLSRWRSAGAAPFVPGAEGATEFVPSAEGATRFVPGTEDAAPFVHASPDEEVALAVANDRFGGCEEPLVALKLDESRLTAPVRYEPADPAPAPGVAEGTLFPHVYGPVETRAVTEVRYVRRDSTRRYVRLDVRPATAETLDLVPHPEGGWYRQTWQAGPPFQPAGYPGPRAPATAIYFLLTPGAESCWHAVRSDELWLWQGGGPLTLLLGGTGPRPGEVTAAVLGTDLPGGQRPQHLVPGGCWQAARPTLAEEVLVTCVVAPGFDFADFAALPGQALPPAGSPASPRASR